MSENLTVRIGADANGFSKELDKMKAKTKSLEKGLASVAKISAAAFVGLATAVGIATSKFVKFEKTFTNIETLLDKSSFKTKTLAKGITGLKNDVLKLGAASGESFDNLNKGLFDLISAGVPAGEATKVLADAVELATAGATDTATAVQALTASITSYGSEAGTSAEIAQKFFTAQKFGVTTVEDLAKGFNKVAGTAKNLKIGFNEILSASSALTANGAKPQAQAFSELNAAMNGIILAQGRLKSQSPEVQNALSLQNIEAVGLVEALNQTRTATGGSVVELQKLLGSAEALSAVLSLTGAQGDLFNKTLAAMSDETSRAANFQDALATKQATTEKALARLEQSFNSVAIQLGERFVPLILKAAEALGSIAQKFNSMTDEQKDSLATWIKWGLAITAGITTVATIGLAIIKLSAILTTIGGVLFTTGGVAAGFWLALTGPIGIAVAGFLAVAAGAAKLYSVLSNEPDDTLENTLSKLDELKEKQQDLEKSANTNRLGQKNRSQKRLDEVNEEIKKLEELKRAQIEASNVNETGSLLIRPETDGTDPFAGLDKDLGQQDIPLAPGVGNEDLNKQEAEKTAIVKKGADERKAVVSQAEQDKIQAAKDANEILKAESINVSAEEIEFLKRRNELEQAEKLANKIKSDELRALELENIKIQNEALIIEQQEHELRKAEELAISREQEGILKEELNALDAEERAALSEKEIEELRSDLLTKKQAKAEVVKEEVKTNIAARNQELKDTEKHGVAVAKINSFLQSEEVKGVQQSTQQLVAMQNSKNSTLAGIGKAAAILQIGIETAQGAVSAFTSMAGLGPVGAAIGGVLAGAVIAFGAEKISQVNSAQRGGIVPGAAGGARDRVPMLLEPNELVVPKGLASNFVQSVGNPASGDFGNSDASAPQEQSTLRLEGDLIQNEEFVTALASVLREQTEFDNVRAS